MRFLETITLLSLLVILIRVNRPANRRQNDLYLIFFAILATLIHLFIEGYRWQMVPTYVLLGLFVVFHKLSSVKSLGVWPKLFLSLLLVLAAVLPITFPVVSFPKPTGPYEIGTVTFHWVDSTRTEWFTPTGEDLREIMVQAWYPAHPNKDSKMSPYMDNGSLRGAAIAEQGGLPSFVPGYLHLIKTHSSLLAQPERRGAPYPVILLSHGLGGVRFLHTVLIEELASHGYVVLAIDHPYDCNLTIFPDGRRAVYASDIAPEIPAADSVSTRNRQLETRVADMRFVRKQAEAIQLGTIKSPLAGLLDLGRVGLAGHSFGGTTSIQMAFEDESVAACLALDGWILPVPDPTLISGLAQPFFYMGRPSWPNPNNYHRLETLIENNHGTQHRITLNGSHHFDYTDTPLFSPLLRILGKSGSIPGRQVVEIVNQYSLAFFDQYLKGKLSPLLSGNSPYPEVRVHK